MTMIDCIRALTVLPPAQYKPRITELTIGLLYELMEMETFQTHFLNSESYEVHLNPKIYIYNVMRVNCNIIFTNLLQLY